ERPHEHGLGQRPVHARVEPGHCTASSPVRARPSRTRRRTSPAAWARPYMATRTSTTVPPEARRSPYPIEASQLTTSPSHPPPARSPPPHAARGRGAAAHGGDAEHHGPAGGEAAPVPARGPPAHHEPEPPAARALSDGLTVIVPLAGLVGAGGGWLGLVVSWE